MKLGICAQGIFILFLLSNINVRASLISDVEHAVEHFVNDPIPSTGTVAKITLEGYAAYSALCIAGYAAYKRYKEMEHYSLDAALKDWRKTFEAVLICFGLVLLSCECGKRLINDVKTLK